MPYAWPCSKLVQNSVNESRRLWAKPTLSIYLWALPVSHRANWAYYPLPAVYNWMASSRGTITLPLVFHLRHLFCVECSHCVVTAFEMSLRVIYCARYITVNTRPHQLCLGSVDRNCSLMQEDSQGAGLILTIASLCAAVLLICSLQYPCICRIKWDRFLLARCNLLHHVVHIAPLALSTFYVLTC